MDDWEIGYYAARARGLRRDLAALVPLAVNDDDRAALQRAQEWADGIVRLNDDVA